MANMLDELDQNTNMEEGNAVHVIAKQIPVMPNRSAVVFIKALTYGGIIIGLIFGVISSILMMDILPLVICISSGLTLTFIAVGGKIIALNDLRRVEQDINAAASTLDNYLAQRVTVIKSMGQVAKEAVQLDKEAFRDIAAMRSGMSYSNEEQTLIDHAASSVRITLECYPELKSHEMLQHLAQEDAYLVAGITEARNQYNSVVNRWNHMIYGWPFYQYEAGLHEYTTRIPYIASNEVKMEGESVLFFAD